MGTLEPNFRGLSGIILIQRLYNKMKIVLIALMFGICQARPGNLEFFEKTRETFGDDFQEKAGEYIKEIDESFHGKQTGEIDEYGWPVHDYESGLSGAIMEFGKMEKRCSKISAMK